MKTLLIIIGTLVAYLGFQRNMTESSVPESVIKTPSLDDLYRKYGTIHGIDPLLLKAVAQVESNENPDAKNPSDPSYGLMQILCQDDGFGSCKNRLNVLDWPPSNKNSLFDPDYSLHIGAQILAWNINRYGRDKGVAVYNSWASHTDPYDGPFSNQGYVDKVLSHYHALGGHE